MNIIGCLQGTVAAVPCLCADILRNDEGNEKQPAAEPILKNLLTALESDQPLNG